VRATCHPSTAQILLIIRIIQMLRRLRASTMWAAAAVVVVRSASALAAPTSATSATATAKYQVLVDRLTEIEKLSGISGLLGWDEMAMMSPGSAAARNDQKSALRGVIYERQTSAELEQAIAALTGGNQDAVLKELPSAYERAVVRDAQRDFELTRRKSKDMAVREAELEGRGYQVWADARATSDFAKFAPVLREVVALKTEIGRATHPHMGAYDANIDAFERGMTVARLNDIFTAAKKELVPLIQRVCSSPVKKTYLVPDALKGQEAFTVEKQKEMCKEIAEAIGFDFSKVGS